MATQEGRTSLEVEVQELISQDAREKVKAIARGGRKGCWPSDLAGKEYTAPSPITGSKKCTKCGEVKPVQEFFRKLRAVDGLQTWCKACMYAAKNRNGANSDEPRAPRKKKQEPAAPKSAEQNIHATVIPSGGVAITIVFDDAQGFMKALLLATSSLLGKVAKE